MLDRVSGDPIAGALLEWSGGSARSDDHGVIGPEPALSVGEEWFGTLKSPGYFPRRLDFASWRELPERVDEDPDTGTRRELHVVELAPLVALKVIVRDTQGEPVEGAYVTASACDSVGRPLSPQPPGWPRFEMPGYATPASHFDESVIAAGTDSLGMLEIPALPVGVPIAVEASLAVEPVRERVVLAGRDGVQTVVLESRATASAEGRVVLPDGSPATGLAVRLTPNPDGSRGPAMRYLHPFEPGLYAGDGRYRFEGVRLGRTHKVFTDTNPDGVRFVCRPGVNELPDLVLPWIGRVTGHLVWGAEGDERYVEGGGPIVRANVDGLEVEAQHTGSRFELTVPTGNVVLCAWRGKRVVSSREVVAPADGVELDLAESTGAVSIATGLEPASRVTVKVVPIDAIEGEGTWDEWRVIRTRNEVADDGTVHVYGLPQGVRGVLVEAAESGLSAWVSPVTVRVGEITQVAVPRFGTAEIRGRVVGAGVESVETRDSNHRRRSTPVAADGSFHFTGLSCGPRLVHPQTSGATTVSIRRLALAAGETRELVLEGGQQGSPWACRVVRNGEGVAGVQARLEGKAPDAIGSAVRETDRTGVCRFPSVAPGTYVLELYEAGEPGLAEFVPVTVTAERVAQVTIDVSKERELALLGCAGEPFLDGESLMLFDLEGRCEMPRRRADGSFRTGLAPGPVAGRIATSLGQGRRAETTGPAVLGEIVADGLSRLEVGCGSLELAVDPRFLARGNDVRLELLGVAGLATRLPSRSYAPQLPRSWLSGERAYRFDGLPTSPTSASVRVVVECANGEEQLIGLPELPVAESRWKLVTPSEEGCSESLTVVPAD